LIKIKRATKEKKIIVLNKYSPIQDEETKYEKVVAYNNRDDSSNNRLVGLAKNFKLGDRAYEVTDNYNESRRTIRIYNQNRWISPQFPGDGKTAYSTNGFNWMLTDYVIEDASYFALREINLGYTIPTAAIKRFNISSVRFYCSAQNLYFHTAAGYRGINPEGRFNNGPYSSVLIDGYQRGSFPIPQTITAGIDINF
jgi:hypothetical protein